jgi:hypothetical protein
MTRHRLGRSCVILAALALTHAPAASAAPTPAAARKAPPKPLAQTLTGPAKADYDSGKLLYADGDFAGALIKFEHALDLSKDPRLLWNIATCQKAQRHYSRVIALLRRYKTEGAALLTPGDVTDATELIAALEPFTAKLTVKVSEEGADVTVDGESVGASPLAAPVVIDIGERHVRVTKEGFLPFEKAIPIGGAEATVDVKLDKFVHEGRLTVNAPPSATVFLDDKPIGTGKIELSVPSGGHQIRITAPGMRPYQSEVLIQDKEGRTLDVTLETLELPRLRVAVGCGDLDPKGPDDGLVAYLDGNDVLPPSGVKKSWDAERNDNVFRYAEYPVTAGQHALRIRIRDCKSLEHTITVDQAGDDVVGALELDKSLLLRGPQGTPGWGRVGVAFWMPTLLGRFQEGPDEYGGSAGSLAGVSVDVGYARRWFSADLSLGVASGSLTRTSFNSNYALPSNPTSHVVRSMLRFGPRFPFNVISFGLGAQAGLEQMDVSGVKTGGIDPALGAYAELVVQPFCTFGFFAMGDAVIDATSGSKGSNNGGDNGPFGFASLQLGAIFQPSSSCKKERGTVFGLREKPRASGQGGN